MITYLKIAGLFLAALLLQMTLLPRYLLDPFQPNLMLLIVVYLGLKLPHRFGALAAFGLGLLQDSFSGIYLGLHAFCYLCIYTLLAGMADRLYTDNRALFVLVAFLATLVAALLALVLLTLFSVSKGLYATLFPALIPQALVNALIASLLSLFPLPAAEEAR
jgi:rod shape-determining protein MreD